MSIKIALAGNPNCGKTTLFNALTGSNQFVGNWPGVTVDKKEGIYKKLEEQISIIDLPGIYSLSPYTPEEVISRNYILEDKPDCIINIVDVTNLERNLYLTCELSNFNIPVVVAVNMFDQLEMGLFHFFSNSTILKYNNFITASSLGKLPFPRHYLQQYCIRKAGRNARRGHTRRQACERARIYYEAARRL